jgi:putative ABC transport system permease protein
MIIGVQGIRARKLRTTLSMLSLFLGVLAVVVVQAGAAIAERAMLVDMELNSGIDGTRMAYVSPENGAADIAISTTRGRADALTLLTINATIGEPGVRAVNEGAMPFDDAGDWGPPGDMICYPNGECVSQSESGAKPVPTGQAIDVRLTAMTGDVRAFKPFRPRAGQWLSFSTIPAMAPRLVLNEEAAKGFARYKVPAEMRINGTTTNMTPQFVGVIDDGDSQPHAYVRLDELTTWMSAAGMADPQMNSDIQVLMAPGAAVEKVLTTRLAAINSSAHVETVRSKKELEKELNLIRLIFLAMAGLVLLIGVAGILNVGLATVGERVEEFALRRAVGTSRALLAGIVLAETLLTGLLTAAAAIGVGAGALEIAKPILGQSQPFMQDLAFPWQAAVGGIVAGLVAGILGGFIPAIRAARIPIATVMRA